MYICILYIDVFLDSVCIKFDIYMCLLYDLVLNICVSYIGELGTRDSLGVQHHRMGSSWMEATRW